MNNKYRTFYLTSLGVLLIASIYPIYMGIVTLSSYFQQGYVLVKDYPKYIIPYTPMSIAIVLIALAFPLLYRFVKRYSLMLGTILGFGIFYVFELFFEQIKVLEGYKQTIIPLESWQYSLCIATPEVLDTIGEPIYADNNPVYKVHFYLISALIIASVTGLIWGYTHLIKTGNKSFKKPLFVQLCCVVTFIGLCILACFTAFYRNGTLQVGTLSAVLMSFFFIVFGMTAGVYTGTLLYGKHRMLSILLPSVISVMTTIVMYIGELVLTGGKLFRFGYGFFYESIGSIPFAPCDILVILISGVSTYVVLTLINKKQPNSLLAK